MNLGNVPASEGSSNADSIATFFAPEREFCVCGARAEPVDLRKSSRAVLGADDYGYLRVSSSTSLGADDFW